MKIELAKKDKILIGITVFLYLIGLIFGGWNIPINLIFLIFTLTVVRKSQTKRALSTFHLVILTVLITASLLIKLGFFLQQYNDYKIKKEYEKKIAEEITPIPSITPTPSPIPSTVQTTQLKDMLSPTITGTIKKLDEDLELVINQNGSGVVYYESGKYISGKYQGYTRIIAVVQGAEMGYQSFDTHVFITNDFKKYILAGNPNEAKAFPLTDYRNPLNTVVKAKIQKIEKIESDLPDRINVDSTFALYKGTLEVEQDKNNVVPTDSSNNKYVLKIDFSNFNRLFSQNSFLKLYSVPSAKIGGWAEQPYSEDEIATQTTNLKDTTGLIVQDRTGLAYSYSLARISSHSLSIKKNEIVTDETLFNFYNAAIPKNCSSNFNTYILSNVSIDQLVSLGKTVDKIELFTLKNKSNPLYELQFASKPGGDYGKGYKEIWSLAEEKMVKLPTIKEYISKNPLLLFKDPWNRWVLLGEFDYQLPGGCGKPVIYLYPEKSQKVTVSFLQPMQFETAIPSYHENWIVQANPNGILTDLQPQYTKCESIMINKVGSEYARQACKENKYPYLYWSGNTIGTPYPSSISSGWYVKKEEITVFMEEKLSQIGLNQKERKDMMEYWEPQMLSKKAPYYRISFLMTNEMNKLIPMKIQPNPHSVLRVFLDFLPLQVLPEIPIKAQIFPHFDRTGFTVVEWGGLRRE